MNQNFIKKIPVLILIVGILALIQELRVLEVNGVNPNLVLSAASAIAFVELPFLAYLGLAGLGAILLQTRFELNMEFFAIIGLAPLFWALRRASPWKAGLGNLIFVSLGTVIFYVAVDYVFILRGTGLLMREIIYNLVIVGALYSLFYYLYETEG